MCGRMLLLILIKHLAEDQKMSGRGKFFTITKNHLIFILYKPLEGENAFHLTRVPDSPLPVRPAPFSGN